MLLDLLLATSSLLFLTATSQNTNCDTRATCGDCITLPTCVWCKDENYNGSAHCIVRGSLGASNCPTEDIVDPRSKVFVQDEEDSELLVSPQMVNVTLRPGQPTSFNISVLSARNFPLDFYMLIDVSASLSDDHAQIKLLSSDITESLANISSNYRIGFGTFVDKSTTPFYSPRAPLRDNSFFKRCYTGVPECVPSYSYRHLLSLTNNNTLFAEELDEHLVTSTGADQLEGGLDAIVQAISCQTLIGWRPQARKILLFVTDSSSHSAGDGRLAGITTPNDLLCHMEIPEDAEHYEYYNWDKTDYPSIGQIRKILIDSNTILLFAVSKELEVTYRNMQSLLTGTFVGVLRDSSANFVEFIEEQYELVRGTMSLHTPQVPSLEVDINPVAGCTSTRGPICENVPLGQTVTFEVNLVASDCSFEDYTFDVSIAGFGRVSVSLDSLCQCDCEFDPIPSSLSMCLNDGELVCGVCECGSTGTSYDCPMSEISNEQCSGRGNCDSCGQCSCHVVNGIRYYGSACQCGDQTCPAPNGVICEGRGDCCGGRCVCTERSPFGLLYTGDACECSPDNNTCIDRSGLICGGRGDCVCNRCSCNNQYTGDVCQTCIAESCQSCTIYRNCVLCAHNISNECGNCTQNTIVTLVELDPATLAEVQGTECQFVDDLCMYTYFVQENVNLTGQFLFEVGLTPDCRSPPGTVSLILIYILVPVIFVAIVLAGLMVLVVIKLIFVYIERKEVKRFETETAEASWAESDNPLYVNPSQKYTNIAYRGKRRSRRGSGQ